MTPQELYAQKLKTTDQALDLIQSGHTLVAGAYACEPVLLYRKLHTVAPRVDHLTVWTGINKEPYPFFSDPICREKFLIKSFFYDAPTRANHPYGNVTLVPFHMHQLGPGIAAQHPDVYMAAVPPMDEDGYFYLSPIQQTEVNMFHAAPIRIFEVNPRVPLVPSPQKVHISEVTCVIDSQADISYAPQFTPSAAERQAAANAASLVHDGDTIQFGLGNLSTAVADSLHDKHDLGVHTEIFCSPAGQLMAEGVITNRRKNFHPGKTVCGFLWGDQNFYDFVDRNPDIELLPSPYVNDPYTIAQNDNMVSINTALQIDLTGQVCSETIDGRQYSGTGGATDFAAGAYMSKGGRGVVVITSTAKGGTVSKIQPILSPGSVVSISRNWVDCIVTEYGVAHLRGASIRQRVEQLIAIAHPDFRADLRRESNKLLLW